MNYLVEFLDIMSGDSFDVSPAQAISIFRAKGLTPTFNYTDQLGRAHAQSFTVAKMMDIDMLGQVRASLDSALANGQPFKEWSKTITPVLKSGGWWGRKEVIDPATGLPKLAQLGSPARLETIFRTNLQSAYAAGQWEGIVEQSGIAPFLMYDAVDDFRTRDSHRAWDGVILPVGSAWWRTHYPPNGYNCRCGTVQLSPDDLETMGLEQSPAAPVDGSTSVLNPRTGRMQQVPNGIDPGFDFNSGEVLQKNLEKLIAEKIALQAVETQAAIQASLAAAAESSALLSAQTKAANLAIAQAAGKSELAKRVALANAKAAAAAASQAAERSAKTVLDAIAGGTYDGKGKSYLQGAFGKLSKQEGFAAGSATQKLAAVQAAADAQKIVAEVASKLSIYKKAILEGKQAPPGIVKAVEGLDPLKKQQFLQTITVELEKAAAAKLAAEQAAAAAAAAAAAEAAAIAAAEAAQKAAKAATTAAKTAATKAANKAAKAAQQTAAPVVANVSPEGRPPNPAKLVQYARKTKGGTPGAYYQDSETGTKYLVKFPGSMDNARNEVLAARLYNLTGIEAPELHAITMPDGQPAMASKLLTGFREVDADELSNNLSMRESFAVDAWLANWDSVGLSYENTVLVGTRAVKIDVGGSLRYRAVGGLKGTAFTDKVWELSTLRDGTTNVQATRVFAGVSDSEIEAGVRKILAVSDADITATIERFGPEDAAERMFLIRTVLARKADLAKRYPGAVPRNIPFAAPLSGLTRITDEEVRLIAESRINGYAIQVDGPEIEQNSVVFHHYTDPKGDAYTRAWLKVTAIGGDKLQAQVGAKQSNSDAIQINAQEFKTKARELVGGINARAKAGGIYESKDQIRAKETLFLIDRLEREIKEAQLSAADVDQNAGEVTSLRELMATIRKISEQAIAQQGSSAQPTGQVGFDEYPLEINFDSKKTAPKAAAPSVSWKKSSVAFERTQIINGRAKVIGKSAVKGLDQGYEAKIDGATAHWLAPDLSEQAGKNLLFIDVRGDDAAAANAAISALAKMGIDTNRTTDEDRQRVYLNSFAALRFASDRVGLRKFVAINDIKEKLKEIKLAIGIDVEKSQGWRELSGRREAFGQGRVYQTRPDLDGPEFESFADKHFIYHNPIPNSLTINGPRREGVAEQMMIIINGGGQAASQIDRLRRGAFTGNRSADGSSLGSDIVSGGADSFFTRIFDRKNRKMGEGFYWKAAVLKRMDAITYPYDRYGATSSEKLTERRGIDAADFAQVAEGDTNETVFRNTLSMFENLAAVVVHNDRERISLISDLKAAGYAIWPDGRKVEDIIIVTKR